ncbi:MAG: phage late control D family protein [Porticoccaceae bacterium]
MSINIYEPVRYITIEGKEVATDISDDILQFSYEDVTDKMDELRLTILDAEMVHIDDPMLQEGKEIKAKWGYIDNLSEIRTCTIKEVEYDFPDGGDPTITIVAYDKGHNLTGRAARTVWKNKTVADIVRDIAGKHKLKPIVQIQEDPPRAFVSQGGKNDMEFLLNLAAEVACVLKIKNTELSFAPATDGGAVVKFIYRGEPDGYLKNIQIKSDAEQGKGAASETTAPGIDPATGKPFAPKSDASKSKYVVNMKDGSEKRETKKTSAHDETGAVAVSTAETEKEAEKAAKSKAAGAVKDAIKADIETIGLPYLCAGMTITIENIGKKFSGDWKIVSVRHVIDDNGYTCNIEATKKDVGKKSDSKSSGSNSTKEAGGGSNAPTASAKKNTVTVDLKKEGE